jgi:hypothetical protein
MEKMLCVWDGSANPRGRIPYMQQVCHSPRNSLGTIPTKTASADPHKTVVDTLWDRVPDAVKAAVAAMVNECIHYCDRCKAKIEIGRAVLRLECGPAPPDWPTDLGTGQCTIDLCNPSLNALTDWVRCTGSRTDRSADDGARSTA